MATDPLDQRLNSASSGSHPQRAYWGTFFLIGATTFMAVVLVLKSLLVFEGQLGRQSTQLAIAMALTVLLTPIISMILLLRHPRSGDPIGSMVLHSSGYLIPGIVLFFGLVLSGFAGWSAEKQAQDVDLTRFERLSDRLHQEIFTRLNIYTYGLKGAQGLFEAKSKVDQSTFEGFLKNWDLEKEFVGAVGIGFAEKIQRSQLDNFLKETRAEKKTDFQVSPLGTHDELFIVKYLVTNFPVLNRILGKNFRDDPRISMAAIESANSGEPTMSLPYGEIDSPEGIQVVYILPVYQKGKETTTPKERIQALQGWIFMVILARNALQGTGNATNDELDFEVFSGDQPKLENLVYDDDNHLRTPGLQGKASTTENRLFEVSAKVSIGGQTWTISTSSKPSFVKASRSGVWQLAGGGALLSLLGAGLLLSLARTAGKAKAIAAEATTSLREQIKLHEQMALVVQQTRNIVVITDANRRIEWVNPAFEQLTGYTLAEVKGKIPGKILQTEKTDPETIKVMREAIHAGQPCRVEVLNQSKNGRIYWLDVEIQPITSDDGSGVPTGFLAVESDITDRKKAEEGMREAIERADLALASANMGSWDWNIEKGVVIYDQRWAEILGYKREELTQRLEEWSSRVHRDDLDRAMEEIRRHFRKETPFYRSLHRMRHRNGTWRWILDSGKLVSRDAQGNPLRMVGTHMDVTEERRVQDELGRREKALTTTSRLAKVGWWELEVDTMTPVWSDQVRDIHEVSADFPVNFETAVFFYPGESRKIIDRCIQNAILQKKSFDVELPFRTAKGKSLWVRVLGEPVVQNERVIKIVGAIQDISDFVAAREKADAASRAKTDFLANMSHEIRTPMTAILGYTELLYEEGNRDKAPRQRLEYIETIQRNGEHLLTIINDILDVSKIEAGKMTLEAIPTDPVQVVEDVVSLMQVRSKTKGILLERVYETTLPRTFPCDPLRLKQILVNLVGNAVKFTEFGKVLIRVALVKDADQKDAIRFRVEDTGVGMSMDQASRLFRPFTQGDETMTRKFGGTGLGLAIAKRLAEMLGGDITVQSELGKGSTLTATVATGPIDPKQLWRPSLHPDEIPATENPASKSGLTPGLVPGNLNGIRILLAEDGIDNQRLITFHLKKAGAEVVVADDGLKAVQALTTNKDIDSPFHLPPRVNLILMDMQMPVMDGYSATRTLRRLGCTIPIIGLTAHAMSGDREKCLQAGCDDYETKPIDRARLINLCTEWAAKGGKKS